MLKKPLEVINGEFLWQYINIQKIRVTSPIFSGANAFVASLLSTKLDTVQSISMKYSASLEKSENLYPSSRSPEALR